MTKFYIGFGVVTIGVVAVVIYGFVLLHSSPKVLSPLEQAQGKSRDARRVSDIHQLQTAFELFYNDCGNYPSAIVPSNNQGCTDGYTTLGSYLSIIPANPTPGGTPYTYTSNSPYNNYSLTFTLEANYNELEAGMHTASSSGIE